MDLTIVFGLLACLGFFYGGTTGFAICPVCGAAIEAALGKNYSIACRKCGTYFEGEGELRPVAESLIAPVPTFSVPLPGFEEAGATVAALSPVPRAMAQSEDRVLEFRWPEGCCVCGKPRVREEIAVMTIVMKAARLGGLLDEKVSLAVGGIPHCSQHQMGVALAVEEGRPVLKFRSLAYRNHFRQLNRL